MNNKKLFKDSLWSTGSHIASLVVVLLCNVFLARLLTPQDFGNLGIIMFFVSVFNVFTDGGLSAALVRRLQKTDDDYATVFTFNLLVSTLLFIIIIGLSGPISIFYDSPSIKYPIMVAGSILLISSFHTIQNVWVLEKLEFKKRSIITFLSSFIGAGIGLILAYFFDFGVWSLIAIPLSTSVIQAVLYNVNEGFYFRLKFSKRSFHDLFGFGINTTLVSVLNLAFDNIYHLVIGKLFSMAQVGFFYQAKKLQDVPNNVVNNLSQSVIYANLSKLQGDKERLITTYNLISKFFVCIMGGIVLFVMFFGDELILLILGAKWADTVPIIKLLIVGSLFYTQEIINKILFKIYNQTGLMLRLEILKKIIQIVFLLITIYFKNIEVLLYGYILTNIVAYAINSYVTNEQYSIGKSEAKTLVYICLLIGALYFLGNQISNDMEFWIKASAIIMYPILLFVFKIVDRKFINNLILK